MIAAPMGSLFRELFGYRACIRNLVAKDLKLKYRESILGFLWSLINPLLMLFVYTIAFKFVMHSTIEHFMFFLLAGLLQWQFFSGSVMSSTASIVGNGNLIRKVYFPREILPVSTVLFVFSQFMLALLVVLPAIVVFDRVSLHWVAVLTLPLALAHLLFTIGCAFALSALTASFRDVTHFTEFALQLLFWLTPLVYNVRMAPRSLQIFFKSSPLAAFAVAYQDLLVAGRLPDPWVAVSVAVWTVLALVVGHWIFRRRCPAFAEMV
jgi:ABC-type polysaccharide/polyol phosphate export permease